MNSRISRVRPAPGAARTEISRLRLSERTSRRLETLMVAIMNNEASAAQGNGEEDGTHVADDEVGERLERRPLTLIRARIFSSPAGLAMSCDVGERGA